MTQTVIDAAETHDLGDGWSIMINRDADGVESAVVGSPHAGSIGLGVRAFACLKAVCRSTQERTHYIAIGPQCWGRAEKQEQAIRNMRKQNSGRMPRDYVVYNCTAGTYVNDMGGFTRNGFDAEPLKVFSTKGLEPKEKA